MRKHFPLAGVRGSRITLVSQPAPLKERIMRKLFIALVAALTIAGSVAAVPGEAEARWRGGAVAAGVIGGLAAGAIIAGATAPYYYAPPPPPPGYYAPAPVY